MTTSYRVSTGIGVALLSIALMATELILTRIFSVIIWYHFAFFAISVALFGGGAAAVWVHLAQHRLEPARTAEYLSAASIALGVTVAAVDLFLINVTPDWFAGSAHTTLTLHLFAVFVLAALPFAVGGLAIALAVTRFGEQVHRIYFWDLVGAGAACVLVVPLLGAFGGPVALLGASCAAGLAAISFSFGARRAARRRFWRLAAGAVIVGGVALGALNPIARWLEVRVAKNIHLEQTVPEFNRWNSFSMVTVLPEVGFRGWGMSPAYRGDFPAQKTLVIDMNALTTLTRFDGSFEGVRYALYDLSALVYHLRPHAERVCVIGAGGGKDVLAALAGGSRHVTAVEINPLIVNDVVRGRYAEFVGGLYDRQDVDVHVEDGRSFIRRTDKTFDIVQLSMVDTSAATAAGAYSLTENSLYTTDAFVDFLLKLEPGGILSVSTASVEGLAVGARLVAIARRALHALGADPARSIAVVETLWLPPSGGVLHDVLIKPDGFTAAEIARLGQSIVHLKFVPAYLPGIELPVLTPEQEWIQRIATAQDDAALEQTMASWPIDVSAVTDDRPFFFYQNRSRDLARALVSLRSAHLFGNGLAILAKVAVIAVAMVVLFLLLPLLLRRREIQAGRGAVGWDLGYVACLGLGFMFVEIALLQRLSLYLGHPTYTLAIVLFALLVAGGTGSRWFGRVEPNRARPALVLVLVGLLVLIAAMLGLADRVLDASLALSAPYRAAVAAALLVPVGLLLGIPFPSGLRAVSMRAGTRLPWLWSINSATSVLGSVLATLVSLHAGISASLGVGAALYAAALLLWLPVSRPPRADEAA